MKLRRSGRNDMVVAVSANLTVGEEDFSHVRALVEGPYRHAEQVILVIDQLNTHSAASFYAAFPPREAKRLAEKLEIHYTPKHGSWLNMAEIALSALGWQCLARRDTLVAQIAHWVHKRNHRRRPHQTPLPLPLT